MIDFHELTIESTDRIELQKITSRIKDIVVKSPIKNGMVFIVSGHTTTGVIVNEGYEDVEVDMLELLDKLAPVKSNYMHAHFLPDYGATGSNAPCHLKSMLTGYNCMFPVVDGKLKIGNVQDIYFAEYDGPQPRKLFVQIMGE